MINVPHMFKDLRRNPNRGGCGVQSRRMPSFDYSAPAELFLAKPAKGSRTRYRRFATAAEALRYVVEDLQTPKALGAWLEVGDARFNSSEIQRLYEADEYPLRKSE